VKPVRLHIGAPVFWIGGLRDDEGPAVRADSQAARAMTAIGRSGQRIADEISVGAGKLEHLVALGVGDKNVARLTVNGHSVRTLELTLAECVTCAHFFYAHYTRLPLFFLENLESWKVREFKDREENDHDKKLV